MKMHYNCDCDQCHAMRKQREAASAPDHNSDNGELPRPTGAPASERLGPVTLQTMDGERIELGDGGPENFEERVGEASGIARVATYDGFLRGDGGQGGSGNGVALKFLREKIAHAEADLKRYRRNLEEFEHAAATTSAQIAELSRDVDQLRATVRALETGASGAGWFEMPTP